MRIVECVLCKAKFEKYDCTYKTKKAVRCERCIAEDKMMRSRAYYDKHKRKK